MRRSITAGISDNFDPVVDTYQVLHEWADQSRVEWHYIAPSKPMQNAFIELQRPAAG